ncbi:hypothetical protein DFP72DRAFT_857653 [Ephemerocybe angulata]|uniref:Uncharacterized protein n=1 Tax=Ephemerocybe angulata TaxID=980116 RepID=A0A8H6HEF8_9AGAR|nr:hypothetical protein DFP72DRAFT_857653 [Tulosesus angulatus]
MQAYRLSKQLLAARYPSRWGQKCGGGHEDMRTSFVWAYLKLKYGEDDGRKTVAGRIFRVTKAPSSKLPVELRSAANRQFTSHLDHDLAHSLGLTSHLNTSLLVDANHATGVVEYDVLHRPDSDTFELHPCPSSPPLEPYALPPASCAPLLSLFDATLNGNLLLGGSVDLCSPYMFMSDSILRLVSKSRTVLGSVHVKLHCHGKRYARRTRWTVPKALLQTTAISDLQGSVLEHSLTLNLNSLFVVSAIQAVLPDARPFSKMTVSYVLSDSLIGATEGRSSPSSSSSSPTSTSSSSSFDAPELATDGSGSSIRTCSTTQVGLACPTVLQCPTFPHFLGQIASIKLLLVDLVLPVPAVVLLPSLNQHFPPGHQPDQP